ncbi:cupin domain-containing protein [Halocalculus aciditolerans]|uniref:Cupin n=1 Tax=Halocalculus aciditolerans TaxID=1383812 RepID=A0A830F3B1_9EURY|nr:cupin domain-containing protein [Halocalculus aciditolerans]GGL50978.1 cupin [Halocalculus aciditolerans]
MEPTNLEEAFGAFEETWSPRVVAELNGQEVKVARLEGEFVWHSHAEADELFYVLDGDLTIEFRDEADAHLSAGDLLVVPAGVEHKPVAEEEVKAMLFEPAETLNTGDADDADLTVEEPERLD